MDTSAWDDIDEDNEDEEKVFEYGGRDGLIFLIDASSPMFIKDETTKEIPFRTCLECCRTTMLNKIISSERDLIAVVLFGTDKSDNIIKVNHVVTLQELMQPSADKIKQIEAMYNSDDFNGFKMTYGHSKDFALSDALWLCQMLFSNSMNKLGSQRILLFTCTDNPHEDNIHRQLQARNKAVDLYQSGVELELLNLGTGFKPEIFYQELIQLALGEDYADFVLPDPTTKLDELLTRVCRRDHKKRTVGKVLFQLGKDVNLGVGIYNLVRRMAMPKRVWLDRSSNETIHNVQQTFDAATGEMMLPLDLSKYQNFGDKKIIFQMDEVKNLRYMVDVGLYLMGFKPSSRIKLHNHFKPSSFIYPDEYLIKGSRQLFAALLQRCLARNVIPICWLVSRRNSSPQLVALVPQEEKLDNLKSQVLPPGFHVVFLPYADNIRNLEIPKTEHATPEEVDMAKQVIKKLRFKYSHHNFDNPKLQTHWSSIESLAMDYDEPRKVIDYTVPNYEAMAKKLGSLSLEFVDTFYPDGFDPEAKVKPKPAAKRQGDAVRTKAAKVVKTTDLDMKDIAQQGKVEKLKVDELKAYLTSENLRVSGKRKADLVSMVYDHLAIAQP